MIPKVLIWTDATAARGLARGTGHSRMKHMESRLLWLRERVAAKQLQVLKLRGEVNGADLVAKALDAQGIQQHLRIIGAVCFEGRHSEAPQLSVERGVMENTSRLLAALACV